MEMPLTFQLSTNGSINHLSYEPSTWRRTKCKTRTWHSFHNYEPWMVGRCRKQWLCCTAISRGTTISMPSRRNRHHDVLYDPWVRINIIPMSLVLESFPKEPHSVSQNCIKWMSGQVMETKGILGVIDINIGECKIFLDFHIFYIPKADPPFILIRRPIEGVINSVLTQDEGRLYHVEVRHTTLECHRQIMIDVHVWSTDIPEALTQEPEKGGLVNEHKSFIWEETQNTCSSEKPP